MGKKNRNRKRHKKALRVASAEVVPIADATEFKADQFKLFIPERIFDKIMYWIKKASPKEVSGFGTLKFDEDTRAFLVTDAYLAKQEVTGGSAEIDDKAIAKLMYEKRNVENALKWHWHSHPTFGVFWSGTDMELIRQLGQKGWIVATVFNLKKESRTAFLTTVDLMGKPHDIFVDDFPLEVMRPVNHLDEKALDREFDENVSEPKPKYIAPAQRNDEWEGYEQIGNVWYPKKGAALRNLYASDYNKFGYAEYNGTPVYNPCYDQEVDGEIMLHAMIDDLKPEEVEFLLARDFRFQIAHGRYLAAKAHEERKGEE